jgi:hypothetical protein
MRQITVHHDQTNDEAETRNWSQQHLLRDQPTYYVPRERRFDWSALAFPIIALGGLALIVYVGLVGWALYETAHEVEPSPFAYIVLYLPPALLLVAAIGMVLEVIQHVRYTRDRHGALVRRAHLDAAYTEREQAYAHNERLMQAQMSAYHGISHYSPSMTVRPGAASDAPTAAIEADARTLTLADYDARLLDAAHIAFFGLSKSGKTTAARALLAEYLRRGDQALVISLAADRADWGVPVVGEGGEAMVVAALRAVLDELARRERDGDRDAPPLRVFVDELTSTSTDEQIETVWGKLMARFVTRARHVNMSLIICAHDNTAAIFGTRGRHLLSRNFLQVWCAAIGGGRQLRIDEGLNLLASGQTERVIWLLPDASPLLARARQLRPDTNMWTDESRLSVCKSTESPPVGDTQTDQTQTARSMMRNLKAKGYSRSDAAKAVRQAGLGFDNNTWSQL